MEEEISAAEQRNQVLEKQLRDVCDYLMFVRSEFMKLASAEDTRPIVHITPWAVAACDEMLALAPSCNLSDIPSHEVENEEQPAAATPVECSPAASRGISSGKDETDEKDERAPSATADVGLHYEPAPFDPIVPDLSTHPRLYKSTHKNITTSMKKGPTTVPTFKDEWLTEEQRKSRKWAEDENGSGSGLLKGGRHSSTKCNNRHDAGQVIFGSLW